MKEEMAEDMTDEEWLNMYFQHNPERGCSYVFGYKGKYNDQNTQPLTNLSFNSLS
jgi:hypothetical protein